MAKEQEKRTTKKETQKKTSPKKPLKENKQHLKNDKKTGDGGPRKS